MSDVPTRVVWKITDAVWIDDDPDCSVIAVALLANGKQYTVTCAGPKGMRSDEFIPAVRVAAAGMMRANGGDMAEVGAKEVGDPSWDTGNQRPS
jgi:hypothetical protein